MAATVMINLAPSTIIQFNVVKELLNKDSNPVPDTDNTMDLANSFGEFFIGKVNKIRDEVDKCATSMSDNVQMFDVSCNVSDDISFDQFASVSDDELLQVIAKCPNKSCVLDVLPSWLLKQHVGVLLPTLPTLAVHRGFSHRSPKSCHYTCLEKNHLSTEMNCAITDLLQTSN